MNTKENSFALDLKSQAVSKNRFFTKLAFSFAFAGAMAVSANVFLYLPGTPVPITLQTITVLFAALFLGSRFALLSQIEYLMLGIMGFPVFAGFKSGITSLFGPTGGYLTGFLFAAFITGYILENFNGKIKNKIYLCLFSFITGLIIIYLTGFVHLLGYTSAVFGNLGIKFLFIKTFDMAIKPFILVEFVKLFIIMDAAVLIKSNSKLRSFHTRLFAGK